MKGFFDCPAQQERLVHHAGKLLGTPFAAHAMIPGAGIDCIHVNAWCYLRTGFLQNFTEPKYTLDAGKHLQTSALFDWLEKSGLFGLLGRDLPTGPVQAGDTLCFRFRARVEHHVGLALQKTAFVHAMQRRCVEIADTAHPPFKNMLTATYRPLLKS